MESLITPSVNTEDAVDHERHGTKTTGFGQLVAANDAICTRLIAVSFRAYSTNSYLHGRPLIDPTTLVVHTHSAHTNATRQGTLGSDILPL